MIQPNNIYCGDCYELIKQIPDKSVDLVYVDIPYLYSSVGKSSNTEVGKRYSRLMNNDLKDIINGIDYSIYDEYVRVLKYIYIYGVVKNKSTIL